MSSGSESDDDYVPGVIEKLSEEESGGDETDKQDENDEAPKTKKRKLKQTARGKKKMKTRNNSYFSNDEQIEEEVEQVTLNPEDEKKREDELWAKFLEGTETVPKNVKKTNDSNYSKPETRVETQCDAVKDNKEVTKQEGDREKRIFEFAGETIVVENDMIKERIKTADGAAKVNKLQGPSRSGGGLANVLDQLNKKNNLSTLEKSKLDWDTYKREEGIEYEITSHNKGKAGYLDRRDFLERTDVRQYEIERDLRTSRRSNR